MPTLLLSIQTFPASPVKNILSHNPKKMQHSEEKKVKVKRDGVR
jgi:hypothetical protein